jgi:hypothetical protein
MRYRLKYFSAILLVLSVGLSIMSCSSGDRPDGERNAAMNNRDISEVKDDHTKELMSLHGVVGVYVGAYDDGTKCIGVMVDTLTPEIEKRIPKLIEGYPVRVEETGVIRPMK